MIAYRDSVPNALPRERDAASSAISESRRSGVLGRGGLKSLQFAMSAANTDGMPNQPNLTECSMDSRPDLPIDVGPGFITPYLSRGSEDAKHDFTRTPPSNRDQIAAAHTDHKP